MKKRQSRRRSEKIRRRLKEESSNWINEASSRITDPKSSSSFNGNFGTKNADSLQHATKDSRFFKVGWRLLSFTLAGIFSFALFTAMRSPQYKVSEVRINGLQRISEESVLNVLNLEGRHILSLESEQLMQNLRTNFPDFRDIQISYSLPAQITINVIERQPVIAWVENNSEIWIDAEGFLIPARGEVDQILTIDANAHPSYHIYIENPSDQEMNIIFDKPLIKNERDDFLFFAFPKQIDDSLLTAILQLNAWMPDEQFLLYQAERGIGWRDIRGWDVFIGSKLEDINNKMLMYETIVRKLEKQGIQPSMVSVEFLHAPYYRLDK